MSTVRINKQAIAKYIREQETEDMMVERISFKEYENPFAQTVGENKTKKQPITK